MSLDVPRSRSARGPLAVLALASATLGLAACSPSYVLRAGWEEAKLLQRSRSIRDVVGDTATSPLLRNRLRLVTDARDFAERALGLDPGDSFTSYAPVARDTLLLVVSASPPYRLSWKTWWFPIVGRVPYRGYFDFDQAREEAERLRRRGMDVHVRPTSAFSTLGWLPDPVLSTTLSGDSVEIVETVIHEITHTTYFPAGQADFNESFATFAGHVGAMAFFCDALRDEEPCRAATDRWHDTRLYGRFLTGLRDTLQALYRRDLPGEEMARRKRRVLEEATDRFGDDVAPRFRAFEVGELEPERLNNAWLLSRVLYYGRLDDFEAVRRRSGGARGAIEAVLEAARGAGAPWRGLDRLLSDAEAAASPEAGGRGPSGTGHRGGR